MKSMTTSHGVFCLITGASMILVSCGNPASYKTERTAAAVLLKEAFLAASQYAEQEGQWPTISELTAHKNGYFVTWSKMDLQRLVINPSSPQKDRKWCIAYVWPRNWSKYSGKNAGQIMIISVTGNNVRLLNRENAHDNDVAGDIYEALAARAASTIQ